MDERMIKAVFLDRDGTINKSAPEHGYIKKWSEFEFLPEAVDAIKLLNDKGIKAIVITNQQGIGKKLMTLDDLSEIHANMQEELGKQNALIDAFYFCPHLKEENCSCRKPKPGMLLKAAEDFGLEMSECIFIGDNERDIEAANAAGCKSIKIDKDGSLLKAVKSII